MKLAAFYCIPLLLLVIAGPAIGQQTPGITQWLTNPDKSQLFRQQPATIPFTPLKTGDTALIAVDDTERFQTIDGFGFALTGGSAQHLIHMSAPARAALLKELFANDKSDPGTVGISYLRLSIGASDLNDHVFSYDDLPGTDRYRHGKI